MVYPLMVAYLRTNCVRHKATLVMHTVIYHETEPPLSRDIQVTGVHVQFSDDVKLLRVTVTLDLMLSFNKRVVNVIHSLHCHIRALCDMRPLLTPDAAKAMMVSVLGSRLDYCNSILYGMPQANVDWLQRAQNVLVQVVAEAPWTISSMNICHDLHRLIQALGQ